MLNYIKSETFRTFKTPIYRGFLTFTILIIAGIVLFLKINNPGFENYLFVMEAFASMAVIIVAGIAATISYKTKDTKVQILSYGIERRQMFLWDLISMQIVALVSIAFLILLALASSVIAQGIGEIESYKNFLKFVGQMTILNINLNIAIMGLIYLTNNISLGIIGQFIIIPLITTILALVGHGKSFEKIFTTLNDIQPYTILQKYSSVSSLGEHWKIIATSFGFVILVYAISGYIAFKRREIY